MVGRNGGGAVKSIEIALTALAWIWMVWVAWMADSSDARIERDAADELRRRVAR